MRQWHIRLRHISRDKNLGTDQLVKMVCNREVDVRVFAKVPMELLEVLHSDRASGIYDLSNLN